MSVPPGVTVFCDPTLAPAVRGLQLLAGYQVSALSAPAGLMLAQLARHTRDDVLFTLSAAMDQAVKQGLVRAETRVDGFSNPLVLAGRAGRPPRPVRQARVAVTDATPASGLDGRAVLAANGLAPALVLGAANTADAAFLVISGEADLGLVYLTDVKADGRLAVVAPVNADAALTAVSGAVSGQAGSPNAAAFLALLRGPAAATLRAAGLGVPA